MDNSIEYYQSIFWHQPLRHPLNQELRVHYNPIYRNTPVNVSKGPMIVPYMDALIDTFNLHQKSYSKIFAVRVDLYFPTDWNRGERFGKDYYSRFMDSLNAKLDAFDKRKQKLSDGRSNDVRFCRVYEEASGKGVHIHAVLFFNGHVFRTLGDWSSPLDNLAHRIIAAWASALGIFPDQVRSEGLLHFSDEGYYLERGASDFGAIAKNMFEHYSYICKAYFKRFDIPAKVLSRSRR